MKDSQILLVKKINLFFAFCEISDIFNGPNSLFLPYGLKTCVVPIYDKYIIV